ncbi:MAG TPA: MFS transporter, partial [Pedobacter sp.]|nr:MFS transporter [Pedobacter sp.]
PIARLYAAGMILSGMSMGVMMMLDNLTVIGIAGTGLMMGMAYGFFWANRVFLALTTTRDENRNYYYGLEALFFTFASIIVPLGAGYLIASTHQFGWFGGKTEHAYYLLTGLVLVLTLIASLIISLGKFRNPEKARFIYFRFHKMWRKMLLMASLKGVAQGFVIAAPVMLIMKLVGEEGSVGSIQSIGSVMSAIMLYLLGRLSAPRHRQKIFTAGLFLFVLGAFVNMTLYNAPGAIFFVGCLVFARPLLDLAYFPVQLGVIECVAAKEKRNQFTYIFSHEVGLYIGRVFGCMLFILIARNLNEDVALRYVLFAVAVVQMLSVAVVRTILKDPEWCEAPKATPLQVAALKEPAEL